MKNSVLRFYLICFLSAVLAGISFAQQRQSAGLEQQNQMKEIILQLVDEEFSHDLEAVPRMKAALERRLESLAGRFAERYADDRYEGAFFKEMARMEVRRFFEREIAFEKRRERDRPHITGKAVSQAAAVNETDSLALVALYNSTNGDNWHNNNNWLDGPVDTWHGVTIEEGRVTEIVLLSNHLSGTIPSELGNLENLTALYLPLNQLYGSIPSELGNLGDLKIVNLKDNSLTGSIPAEFGNLGDLIFLDLSWNYIKGSIPAALGNLEDLGGLKLSNNRLTGSIPAELGNMGCLRTLDLRSNQLTGSVPAEFCNMGLLRYLDLRNNQLTFLPDLTGLAGTLTWLFSVSENRLTFESIEPNISMSIFNYTPQDRTNMDGPSQVEIGDPFELSVTVGGNANLYQWIKDGEIIPGAESPQYTVSSSEETDAGLYYCRITNTIATALTIFSREKQVEVGRETAIHIKQHPGRPSEFALDQNYPNPFNPETCITFSISEHGAATLTVYDMQGRTVRRLADGILSAGRHEAIWHGDDENGQIVASGVYFYVLRSGKQSLRMKAVFMK